MVEANEACRKRSRMNPLLKSPLSTSTTVSCQGSQALPAPRQIRKIVEMRHVCASSQQDALQAHRISKRFHLIGFTCKEHTHLSNLSAIRFKQSGVDKEGMNWLLTPRWDAHPLYHIPSRVIPTHFVRYRPIPWHTNHARLTHTNGWHRFWFLLLL